MIKRVLAVIFVLVLIIPLIPIVNVRASDGPVEYILSLEFNQYVPTLYMEVGGDPRDLPLPYNVSAVLDSDFVATYPVSWLFDEFDELAQQAGKHIIRGEVIIHPYDIENFGTRFHPDCDPFAKLTVYVGVEPDPDEGGDCCPCIGNPDCGCDCDSNPGGNPGGGLGGGLGGGGGGCDCTCSDCPGNSDGGSGGGVGGGLGGGPTWEWGYDGYLQVVVELIPWDHKPPMGVTRYLDFSADPRDLDLSDWAYGVSERGYLVGLTIDWLYDDFDSSLPGDQLLYGELGFEPVVWNGMEYVAVSAMLDESLDPFVSVTVIVGEDENYEPPDGLYLIRTIDITPGFSLRSFWGMIVDEPELWVSVGEDDESMGQWRYVPYSEFFYFFDTYIDEATRTNHLFLELDYYELERGFIYEFEIRYLDGDEISRSIDALVVDMTGDEPEYGGIGGDRYLRNRGQQDLPEDEQPGGGEPGEQPGEQPGNGQPSDGQPGDGQQGGQPSGGSQDNSPTGGQGSNNQPGDNADNDPSLPGGNGHPGISADTLTDSTTDATALIALPETSVPLVGFPQIPQSEIEALPLTDDTASLFTDSADTTLSLDTAMAANTDADNNTASNFTPSQQDDTLISEQSTPLPPPAASEYTDKFPAAAAPIMLCIAGLAVAVTLLWKKRVGGR